jgi:SAM-dependent methyltransferase
MTLGTIKSTTMKAPNHLAIGSENLNLMRLAPRYAKHIGSLVSNAIEHDGTILELGSGDGFQTSFVMAPNKDFHCIESDSAGREKLVSRGYQVSERLESFANGEISSIFSINCLEHIENDGAVVSEIGDCLKKNGKLILFVPAFNFLYSSMDTRVGHFRRYSRKSIRRILTQNDFRIEKLIYVDSVGALLTLMFKLARNRSGAPSEKSLVLFDKYFFPISCFLDKFFSQIFGKNIFVIARKN